MQNDVQCEVVLKRVQYSVPKRQGRWCLTFKPTAIWFVRRELLGYKTLNVDGEAQPAAIQISCKDILLDHAHDEGMPLVECALTPKGHSSPFVVYAIAIN